MKLLTVELKAGIPRTIGRGRFVRMLEGQFPVEVETQALGTQSNETGKLVANIGAEFHTFERAVLTSEYDQQVTIAYSELAIYDNRLGVDGALIVETVARGTALVEIKSVPLVAGARAELVPIDARRRTAILSTTGPVKVFTTAAGGSGFSVDGVLDHESQAALYAEGDGVTVEVMEYLN